MPRNLTDDQLTALRKIGWQSSAEKKALAAKLFWKKAAAWAVGIALFLFLLGRFDERKPPPEWSCQTRECTGHWAGFDWAHENGVYEERHCPRHARSFYEGCLSWIETAGMPDDY